MTAKALNAQGTVLHFSVFDFVEKLVVRFAVTKTNADSFIKFLTDYGGKNEFVVSGSDKCAFRDKVMRESNLRKHKVTWPEVFQVDACDEKLKRILAFRSFLLQFALCNKKCLPLLGYHSIFHAFLPFPLTTCVLGGSQVVGTSSLRAVA